MAKKTIDQMGGVELLDFIDEAEKDLLLTPEGSQTQLLILSQISDAKKKLQTITESAPSELDQLSKVIGIPSESPIRHDLNPDFSLEEIEELIGPSKQGVTSNPATGQPDNRSIPWIPKSVDGLPTLPFDYSKPPPPLVPVKSQSTAPQRPVGDQLEYLTDAVHLLLRELTGDEKLRPGLQDTPGRVARMFLEITAGERAKSDEEILGTNFKDDQMGQEMVTVKNVPFRSTCEHHLCQFTGTVHFGYIPNRHIVGLSKIPRLIEKYSLRLQVQERLTTQIIEAFQNVVKPKGTILVIKSEHSCMSARGVRAHGAETVTTAIRGVFTTDESAKSEFYRQLGV